VKVNELTWGQGADQALVTVAVVDEKMISDAFEIVGKGRVIVVTCMAAPDQLTVHVSGAELTKYGKTIKGSMFGSLNPHYDIVKLLRLYEEFAAQVARRDHGRGSSRTPTSSGSTSTGRASLSDTQVGATGVRILATMLRKMDGRQARYALETMCICGRTGPVGGLPARELTPGQGESSQRTAWWTGRSGISWPKPSRSCRASVELASRSSAAI
jgi:hypothetical protein